MRQTLGLHVATPRDYVQQLKFRHAISPHVYRSILNSFYRFVAKRTENARVAEKVVREWLKARHRVCLFTWSPIVLALWIGIWIGPYRAARSKKILWRS